MSKRVDEEPKQPFEYMAENKDSQQPGSGKRPLKQSALPFSKKAESDDEDLDSDDDDELAGFDFRQHKADKTPASKVVAVLQSSAEEKKKTQKSVDRTLIQGRWPRGKVPLPEGWTARLYRYGGKNGKEIWVFSHPYYGETQHQSEMRRTEEEWEAVLDKRHAKKPAGAAKATAESSADADADADADAAPSADPDDPLAALLLGKRRREEEEEAIKEQVKEEMAMRMDTGVRVNQSLNKMLG